MSTPADTDRIIEAQAEQAHKTRVLLVWLLLGIPVLAGLVWLGVGLAAAHKVTDQLNPDAAAGAENAIPDILGPTTTAPPKATDPNASSDFAEDITYAHQVHHLSDRLYGWYKHNQDDMESIGASICSANRDSTWDYDAATAQAQELLADVPHVNSDVKTLVTISTGICPG